ncbi:hypothetical protein GWK47_036808 [Chionoecetes opilio]|uniref:Reverse transcriptase RNase H-like domain-containing protein n=1 Tax=Chionoecetes opilio TaxID=41210 RepID=A0A8J4YGZ5_CHIOP|nr:hypothetical protein GWK47_036808 [Chionoecetes opilio]
MVRPRQPGRALPGGRPCHGALQGATQETGWEGSVLGQAVGGALHLRKDTIGRLAAEGLRYYDVSRPTAVLTDYSRQGIGFLVLQQYCECVSEKSPLCCPGGWKLVLCGSRHLTAAERNYSTLEGEALAIAGA